MELRTPLQAADLLSRAVGRKLVRVVRQVMPDDYAFYPEETRDQLSDGTLDLFFADGHLVHLESWTEKWSVTVGGEQHLWRDCPVLDVTDRPFWRSISGQVLQSVHVLVSPHGRLEFGILFTMANGATFVVEYQSNRDFVDQILIRTDLTHVPQELYSLMKI